MSAILLGNATEKPVPAIAVGKLDILLGTVLKINKHVTVAGMKTTLSATVPVEIGIVNQTFWV